MTAERRIGKLLDVMARLRDPSGGCPWDIEQTFETIAPYTIEEAYEVADAIARGDRADLKEELGDLLFQVVYHARMAEEDDAFDFAAVVDAIAEKMIRRHPHVFGDAEIESAKAQTSAWEQVKAAERAAKGKERTSILDDIPLALPALTRAEKLQKRAARVGFDWPAAEPVLAKIEEEIGELRAVLRYGDGVERARDEFGDLLFALANLGRHLGLDPEEALRSTNRKFDRRFRYLEQAIETAGRRVEDATLDELEELWQAAKTRV